MHLYCKSGQTPEQVAHRRCRVSTLEDIPNTTGHGPEQPARVYPALSKAGLGLDDLQRRPQPFPKQRNR